MLRFFALIGLITIVSGCQTGSSDTAGTLSSATGDSELATLDTENQETPTLATGENANGDVIAGENEIASANNTDATNGTGEEQESAEVLPAPQDVLAESGVNPVVAKETTPDPLISGIQSIASIRNNSGETAAVRAVFDCYKKARAKTASLDDARLCATQDFVVSREVISNRPKNAAATNDRALLVSNRHAERIGALMKLKGMNQSQFNSFGRYLHAVAEPEYQKARTS